MLLLTAFLTAFLPGSLTIPKRKAPAIPARALQVDSGLAFRRGG